MSGLAWVLRRQAGFLCKNPACTAVTFVGQADGLTVRYQRRSVPLARSLSQIALELAGRAGARLAAALGIAVHRSTLLRLVETLRAAASGPGRPPTGDPWLIPGTLGTGTPGV